ncbi:MAG TPA: hypothetical protein VH478_09645 [Trebonia sp.]|nr:hypothetical protein [Trebonia sp.]
MAMRPERVPAEQIRRRMLEAGRELALEAGAALTIEHLRLEEVIQRARVPRSSAYRLWPYKEDYIEDLLAFLAGAGSLYSDRPIVSPDTAAAIARLFAENQPLLATLEGRRSLMREAIRRSTEHNYHALARDPVWRLHMALVATLGATGGGDAAGPGADPGRAQRARQRVAIALEEAQSRSRAVMAEVFRLAAVELGLRLRDPAWTIEHLQLAGGLFVQSMALRNVQVQTALGRGDAGGGGAAAPGAGASEASDGQVARTALVAHVDQLLNAPVPGPGLHGQVASWTLASLAYLGMVDAFVDLDPDFVPPGPGDGR